MNIISKLSFWIKKPEKQTMNSSDGFEQVIMDALAKFKRDGYVKKLKTSITSVPSDNQDLLVFLYNQIASIQANGMCSIQNSSLHDLLNAIKVYCNVLYIIQIPRNLLPVLAHMHILFVVPSS